MNYAETIQLAVAMIIMMNPLGSLSIFLQLTRRAPPIEQQKIAVTTCITILIILLGTVWTGNGLLALLGITIPSFRFAGGIILLLMGLSMLQSQESALNYTSEDNQAAKERQSIAVVPLALPVIVGPGAMSTLIIYAGDYPTLANKISMSFICILLGLGMGLMLFFGHSVAKFVGISVMKVVTRIMGMIIMAIAVGMLAEGLLGLIPSLR